MDHLVDKTKITINRYKLFEAICVYDYSELFGV